MLEVKEPTPNRLDDPREFLNIIAYSEMVRRGMTDKKIMLYYSITRKRLYRFKKENGLLGMERGALHDYLQALQSPVKKHKQYRG